MQEDVDDALEMAKLSMDSAIEHLQKELVKIRAGKASPAILTSLLVPYYGSPTPLNQVANVSTSDARTLVIQPWEKNMLAPIEKAIFEANLGLTPMNNGEIIMINVPPLTEERRKQYVKSAKDLGEDAKISIRNARRDANSEIKKVVGKGYPEDLGKRAEDKVQELTDKYGKKIDDLIKAKENDIMTI